MQRISWIVVVLAGLFPWAGCSGSANDQPTPKSDAGDQPKPAAPAPPAPSAPEAAEKPATEEPTDDMPSGTFSDEPVAGPDLSQPVAPMPEDVDQPTDADPFGTAAENGSAENGSAEGGSSVAKSLGRALFRGAQSAGGGSQPEQPDEAMPFGP